MRKSLFAVAALLLPLTARAQVSIARSPHNQQIATWTCWWEANREPYLQRAVASRPNYVPETRDTRDARAVAEAVVALRAALKSEIANVRAEAVVALARIEPDSLTDILPLTTDPDLRARRRAWLSLGLVDSERELLRNENLPEDELEAIAAGLALVNRLGDVGFERLRRWADQAPSWQVQRMAIWAIRVQHAVRQAALATDPDYRPPRDEYTPDPATDRELVFHALRTTTNELLAEECIAALGTLGQGDDRSAAALQAILAGDPQSLSLPVFKSLLTDARREHPDNAGYTMGLRRAAALAIGELKDVGQRRTPTFSDAPQGRAAPYNPPSALTSSSAPPPAANNSLETLLTTCAFRRLGDLEPYAGGRYRTFAYPEAATIAAARIGRGDVPANLVNLTSSGLWGADVVTTRYVYDPQRGLAALALGIYYNTPSAQDTQLTSTTARPGDPAPASYGGAPQGSRAVPQRQQTVSRGGGRLVPGANDPTPLPGATYVGPFPNGDNPVAAAVSNMGDVLLNHARMDNETEGLRAACALATGLAGQPFRASSLIDIARRVNPQNLPLLQGELALGLALLNDPRALDLARPTLLPDQPALDADKLLKLTTNDAALNMDPDGVPVYAPTLSALLGARASLTAIATLQDPRATPMLLGNWGQNVFLSLESARAMRWCHAYAAVPALSALATQTEKPRLAALAIRSLGEILDRDTLNPRILRMVQPHSFGIAVARSNLPPPVYTNALNKPAIHNRPRYVLDPDLHALAQPLLYTAGGTWWDVIQH